MNRYTTEIMELLKVDAETAMKVQENMSCDFSECSKREFNRNARDTYEILKDFGNIK